MDAQYFCCRNLLKWNLVNCKSMILISILQERKLSCVHIWKGSTSHDCFWPNHWILSRWSCMTGGLSRDLVSIKVRSSTYFNVVRASSVAASLPKVTNPSGPIRHPCSLWNTTLEFHPLAIVSPIPDTLFSSVKEVCNPCNDWWTHTKIDEFVN